MTALKKRTFYLLLILILCGTGAELYASPKIAFGFFSNDSGNPGLNYLETILPNSFASSLKNTHKVSTLKPRKLAEIFRKNDLELKKKYSENELVSLSDRIDADYFIYGSFRPKGYDRIELRINIYEKDSTRLFSFTDTGYLETEIFKLVDRISKQLNNIASESMSYHHENISPGARVAVVTNAEGSDLNSIFFEFMTKGFRISQFQGNSLKSAMADEAINRFYHISTEDASFRIISDRKDIKLYHGTWSGADYFKNISAERDVYNKYAFNYGDTKNRIIQRMNTESFTSIDYLVIIGFDESRECAWIRCINLRNRRLISTHSGIEGSSVNGITQKIIKKLTSGMEAGI